MTLGIFFGRFWNSTQILNFIKIRPAGAELFHSDGRTGMTMLVMSNYWMRLKSRTLWCDSKTCCCRRSHWAFFFTRYVSHPSALGSVRLQPRDILCSHGTDRHCLVLQALPCPVLVSAAAAALASKYDICYLLTYILTYIHTYLHTYLHTYILT
jgi:hypothetical protein